MVTAQTLLQKLELSNITPNTFRELESLPGDALTELLSTSASQSLLEEAQKREALVADLKTLLNKTRDQGHISQELYNYFTDPWVKEIASIRDELLGLTDERLAYALLTASEVVTDSKTIMWDLLTKAKEKSDISPALYDYLVNFKVNELISFLRQRETIPAFEAGGAFNIPAEILAELNSPSLTSLFEKLAGLAPENEQALIHVAAARLSAEDFIRLLSIKSLRTEQLVGLLTCKNAQNDIPFAYGIIEKFQALGGADIPTGAVTEADGRRDTIQQWLQFAYNELPRSVFVDKVARPNAQLFYQRNINSEERAYGLSTDEWDDWERQPDLQDKPSPRLMQYYFEKSLGSTRLLPSDFRCCVKHKEDLFELFKAYCEKNNITPEAFNKRMPLPMPIAKEMPPLQAIFACSRDDPDRNSRYGSPRYEKTNTIKKIEKLREQVSVNYYFNALLHAEYSGGNWKHPFSGTRPGHEWRACVDLKDQLFARFQHAVLHGEIDLERFDQLMIVEQPEHPLREVFNAKRSGRHGYTLPEGEDRPPATKTMMKKVPELRKRLLKLPSASESGAKMMQNLSSSSSSGVSSASSSPRGGPSSASGASSSADSTPPRRSPPSWFFDQDQQEPRRDQAAGPDQEAEQPGRHGPGSSGGK